MSDKGVRGWRRMQKGGNLNGWVEKGEEMMVGG